jgi:hypothetical protein
MKLYGMRYAGIVPVPSARRHRGIILCCKSDLSDGNARKAVTVGRVSRRMRGELTWIWLRLHITRKGIKFSAAAATNVSIAWLEFEPRPIITCTIRWDREIDDKRVNRPGTTLRTDERT